jgi:hypothetical protein
MCSSCLLFLLSDTMKERANARTVQRYISRLQKGARAIHTLIIRLAFLHRTKGRATLGKFSRFCITGNISAVDGEGRQGEKLRALYIY